MVSWFQYKINRNDRDIAVLQSRLSFVNFQIASIRSTLKIKQNRICGYYGPG